MIFNPFLKTYGFKVQTSASGGNTDLELTDKLMNRIKEVAAMTDKDKDYVYTLIDAFIVLKIN